MARGRILIVEDSALVTDALRILFDDAGYDVAVAGSVSEAVEVAESSPTDVMLLDLTLPDGDGIDVVKTLRRRSALPRVTIAMTGHTDAESRAKCLEAGCAEVLLKPVPVGELLRQIEHHLA
ncbi:MAG: response regulator [Gemmatimonadaceae bacterium]